MGMLFIDEKGTQERYKISKPFDSEHKIAYGTDKMHSYVSCAIYVNRDKYNSMESQFLSLETEYLKRTQNPKMELKSDRIFKKRFEFGVKTLRQKDVSFYSDLFKILIENECDILTYSISKMSVAINVKLLDWFYILDEKKLVRNIFSLKYVITKYMNNEASEDSISILLDANSSAITLLNVIQRELKKIVKENKKNERMALQTSSYSEIIDLIIKYKHFADYQVGDVVFDWEQVAGAIDLWQTERKHFEIDKGKDVDVYLDQGIPPRVFSLLDFRNIFSDCDSSKYPGIRIADLLVGFYGNFVKSIAASNVHNHKDMHETKFMNSSWFDLDESRFALLKYAETIYLGDGTFPFIFDTFFDDQILFFSFVRYVGSFKSFSIYNQISKDNHRDEWHEFTLEEMRKRYEVQSCISSSIHGRTKELVSMNMLKKL